MNAPRRLWLTLRQPLGGPEGWGSVVLDGAGLGLGRVLLAALFLTLALTFLVMGEVNRVLDEAPFLLKDLPALELRGGRLVADPPLAGPLVLRNREGRELALLDLDGTLRLEEREAILQVTGTRLLVKGADGQVQAFPLGSAGRPDSRIDRAQLLDFLGGTARGLALAMALPFLFVISLGLLMAEAGLVALLALVPDQLYHTGLAGPALLRLCAMALVPGTLLVSLALAAGLPLRQPSLATLVLSLALVLRGVTAVAREQGRRTRSGMST